MPEYDTWESLVEAAQQRCANVLTKDVAPIATAILKRHIISDIYGAYTPIENGWVNGTTYQRRHVLENSLYHTLIATDEILITSNATTSKSVVKGYSFHNRRLGSFLKLLESGNMGIWRNGFPRPAVSNAQAEIDRSTEIRNSIQRGLNREFNA